MLSKELINPVFTDTARGGSQAVGVPHLRTPCYRVKTFFNLLFSEINLKTMKNLRTAVFLPGDPGLSINAIAYSKY